VPRPLDGRCRKCYFSKAFQGENIVLYGILVALHLVVSVILILVVLLQTGKGADLAGAFGGGGSQTAFGSRGAATVLSKLTTTAAVVFMLTSFSLAILSARGTSSVLDETGVGAAPAAPMSQPVESVPAAEPLDSGTEADAAGDPSSTAPVTTPEADEAADATADPPADE